MPLPKVFVSIINVLEKLGRESIGACTIFYFKVSKASVAVRFQLKESFFNNSVKSLQTLP